MNIVITPESSRFGFCEGVERAHLGLTYASDVAREYGIERVFGFHDIVHNEHVTRYHENRGVVFVDDYAQIPNNSIAILSAHGSSPKVSLDLEERGGLVFDAACPLVVSTHAAVWSARKNGEKLLYLVGSDPRKGGSIHDEVLGTMGHIEYTVDGEVSPVDVEYAELGQSPDDIASRLIDGRERYRLFGQTTLLAKKLVELKEQVAQEIALREPNARVARVAIRDVCFAVQERQEGVRGLLNDNGILDHFVVVTDPNSKNGRSYVNLARGIISEEGLPTLVHAVEHEDDIDPSVSGRIAVTASASTPDEITRRVVKKLGGNEADVPLNRPTFPLKGVSKEVISKRVKEWLHAA